MPNSELSDVQVQNLLAAVTDALLEDDSTLDELIAQHQVTSVSAQGLLRLVNRLYQVFIPVQPSPRFVRRLRQDLMGQQNSNVLVQVRRLPPRVQIAAGLALVAGFVILSRRRPGSPTLEAETQETAAAR
jgi:hypothetical protein